MPARERGHREYLVHKNEEGELDMMALMWVGRERRYFILATSTHEEGTLFEQIRWRQNGTYDERILLTVRQPKVAETYYAACAAIDKHNRCRQYDLRLERKITTHMAALERYAWWMGRTQGKFYEALASQLIDNPFDYVGLRPRPSLVADEKVTSCAVSAFGPRLTPTKKLKRNSFSAQRNFHIYKARTTFAYSSCREISNVYVFLCSYKKGWNCFQQHQAHNHGISS